MKREDLIMNAIANLQMLDSYVKEFSINLQNRIEQGIELNIDTNVGFAINNITKEKEDYKGQIEMFYDIDLKSNENDLGKIHILMQAIFSGKKELSQEEFTQMLKLNGATTISHLIRAYIHTNTSLSNMPIIDTPMINFVEFFEENEK